MYVYIYIYIHVYIYINLKIHNICVAPLLPFLREPYFGCPAKSPTGAAHLGETALASLDVNQ